MFCSVVVRVAVNVTLDHGICVLSLAFLQVSFQNFWAWPLLTVDQSILTLPRQTLEDLLYTAVALLGNFVVVVDVMSTAHVLLKPLFAHGCLWTQRNWCARGFSRKSSRSLTNGIPAHIVDFALSGFASFDRGVRADPFTSSGWSGSVDVPIRAILAAEVVTLTPRLAAVHGSGGWCYQSGECDQDCGAWHFDLLIKSKESTFFALIFAVEISKLLDLPVPSRLTVRCYGSATIYIR